MIAIGDELPDVPLKVMADGRLATISPAELSTGKRLLLFAVPGAFTSTCSDEHLPGYLLRADELRAAGVDLIACVAVNDAEVMAAWGRATGVDDRILMLADGNGDFARAMGLEVDLSRFGMGRRSRRYAALVEGGVVRGLWVEPAGAVTVSGAETVLAALSPPAGGAP